MKKGFTILELMVVIGIIGLLAAIAYPTYSQMQSGVAVKQHANEVVNALRNAQHRSIIAQDGTAHGVHFNADSYVIFGDSWSAPSYTFTQQFSNGVQITQGVDTEIMFNKLTGDTINVEIKIGIASGNIREIIVNEFGRVVLN